MLPKDPPDGYQYSDTRTPTWCPEGAAVVVDMVVEAVLVDRIDVDTDVEDVGADVDDVVGFVVVDVVEDVVGLVVDEVVEAVDDVDNVVEAEDVEEIKVERVVGWEVAVEVAVEVDEARVEAGVDADDVTIVVYGVVVANEVVAAEDWPIVAVTGCVETTVESEVRAVVGADDIVDVIGV